MRDGGRHIELFVPVEFLKQKVDAVTIKPVKLDHFIRWESGEIATALALLSELSGLQQTALRQINYPDIERVMAAFVSMLPAKIAANIERGEVPVAGQPTVGEFRRVQAEPVEHGAHVLPAVVGVIRIGHDIPLRKMSVHTGRATTR